MIQDRIALTEIPNLDVKRSEPTFNVHSRDVAAVYGSHDVVHFSSGPEVYGTALDRGFDYHEPAAPPICKPVATLVPARHSVRDYRDEGDMGQCSPYSPPQGWNTRRCEWSPVSSRQSSGAANHRSVSPTSRLPCSLPNGDDGRVSEGPGSVSHETGTPVEPVHARSVPSVSPVCSLAIEDPMPFTLPHLEWTARVNGPAGFTTAKLLLDSACPFVLIHTNLVSALGLKCHKLHRPQEMSLAMSAGKPEIFCSTDYCKLSLEDPHLAWRSHTVRALVVPF
ncbi:hypothetical protein GGU11DRAFT_746519 [Lentinula aff. detonsa]|nr:hypothetical protein GGU11DRAFT_746519 [Lentinula aff. detonsa]